MSETNTVINQPFRNALPVRHFDPSTEAVAPRGARLARFPDIDQVTGDR
jgi:hypothetical protein